jgi:hypothetical protein
MLIVFSKMKVFKIQIAATFLINSHGLAPLHPIHNFIIHQCHLIIYFVCFIQTLEKEHFGHFYYIC